MGHYVLDSLISISLLVWAINGWIKGFIVGVAGVAGLVGAFWAAGAFNADLAARLVFVSDPAWRPLVAYVLIFMAILFAAGFIARILRKAVSFAFADWLDKTLGFIFGACKGVLIWVLVFVVLIKLFPNAVFVRDSFFYPYYLDILDLAREWIPPSVLNGAN